MAGKGSKPRNCFSSKFKKNYDSYSNEIAKHKKFLKEVEKNIVRPPLKTLFKLEIIIFFN